MCLEDLRLGRGRNVRSMQQIDAGGTAKIPPDAARVAIAILGNGRTASGDYLTVFIGDQPSGQNFFVLPVPPPVTVLRIEDLGKFITQGMVFLLINASTNAFAQVVDIYTEVNAQPLDTYKT